MSQTYNRLAAKRLEYNRQRGSGLDRMAFDDSNISEFDDIPNIFEAPQEQYFVETQQENLGTINKGKRKQRPQNSVKKGSSEFKGDDTINELNAKVDSSNINISKEIKPRGNDVIELIDDSEIPQGEEEIEPNTQLGFWQICKLYLGLHRFTNVYPAEKIVYIDNNNEEQNEMHRKQSQAEGTDKLTMKNFYDNQLKVSSLLGVLAVLASILTRLEVIVWAIIVILSFIADGGIFSNMQYSVDPFVLLGLLLAAIVIDFIMSLLAVRKRRQFNDSETSYKVYYHNGHTAEWVMTKAIQIKTGHVIKVPQGERVPIDCVFIHAASSLIQISQSSITSQLLREPSEVVFKEAVIKAENIVLPISGHFRYTVHSADMSNNQITGVMQLNEPVQIVHNVTGLNILLRGSVNTSKHELVCLVMETGIDSLTLKQLQYPRQLTPATNEGQTKQLAYEVIAYESQLFRIMFWLLLTYLVIVGVGILFGYIISVVQTTHFYVSQSGVPIWRSVIYYFMNTIVVIPIFLPSIIMLYVCLGGKLAESKLSKRTIELSNDRSNRMSESMLKEPVPTTHQINIKDYNMLYRMPEVDIIVTTIDTLRNSSSYTLHSIRIKQLSHSFITNRLENDAYSIEEVELIKYFMSVSLLTTVTDEENSVAFDLGIEQVCRRCLSLVKTITNGQVIVNNGEFKVKHLFSIKALPEYPYKISFLQTVVKEKGVTNAQEKVLVLVRGNPQIVLDKVYGKQVKMAEEGRRLYEEKGYHVQVVCKMILSLRDVQEIEKAYMKSTLTADTFYKNLDRYLAKLQPMGLLVFVNQFHQNISVRNPVLNHNVLNTFPNIEQHCLHINSSDTPPIVVIAPQSHSIQPQFESIHTITNLLINPYLFNYSLPEVSDKILHDAVPIDRLVSKLTQQRVVVWNGWQNSAIITSCDELRESGKKLLVYIERDEYLYLARHADFVISGTNNDQIRPNRASLIESYDLQKYSDIEIASKSNQSFLYILQMMRYDGVIAHESIIQIILTQVCKSVMFGMFELIHIFFTRGTGLAIVRSPLHLLVEIILVFDVLYYLNWDDSMRVSSSKTGGLLRRILQQTLYAIVASIFIALICIYSLVNPSDSSGTTTSHHFINSIIVYTALNVLVMNKLFQLSFSLYRLAIVAVQLGCIYLGFIIISSVSSELQGIIWYLFQGKMFLTAVTVVWICLAFAYARRLWISLPDIKKRFKITK